MESVIFQCTWETFEEVLDILSNGRNVRGKGDEYRSGWRIHDLHSQVDTAPDGAPVYEFDFYGTEQEICVLALIPGVEL